MQNGILTRWIRIDMFAQSKRRNSDEEISVNVVT